MEFDVFISHSSDDNAVVELLIKYLEANNVSCFVDFRDIPTGKCWAAEVTTAIEKCKLMVVVFSDSFNASEQVDREVEICAEEKKPILTYKITNSELKGAKKYYLKNLNWINAFPEPEKYFGSLLSSILKLIRIDESKIGRYTNDYFKIDDEKERERLVIQSKLLRSVDMPILEDIIKGKTNVNLLDVGCNDGKLLFDRFGDKNEVERVVGVDINEDAINEAKKTYAGNSKFIFDVVDCADKRAYKQIRHIMKHESIEFGFDIISISMVLLHVKEPLVILSLLNQLLVDGGIIFIRDIDDRLNIACPDDQNSFKRTFDICNKVETSGNRHSGCEIYSILKDIGYRNVRLEYTGMSNIGLDYNQKDALFNTYFSFIHDDLRIMREKYPDQKVYEDYQLWYSNAYEDLELAFHKDNFLFKLGFVIYTAIK